MAADHRACVLSDAFAEPENEAAMLDQDEVEPAAPEVPRKLMQSLHNVQVNAHVATYSYDGLADFRSLVNILTTIAPRQLILIHGSQEVRIPTLCLLMAPFYKEPF